MVLMVLMVADDVGTDVDADAGDDDDKGVLLTHISRW